MFFRTSIWQESLFIAFFPILLKNQESEDFAEDMQKPNSFSFPISSSLSFFIL